MDGWMDGRIVSKRHHFPSSSSSSDSSASDSESSSSPSDGKKSKKAKKKKKKKVSQFGKRMKHPEDVKHRYMFVLKTFKKTHSLNRSCEKLNVDRNTIAYTAVIAEVLLVADSKEKCRVPPFTGGSLLKYAKEVKVFLDDEPELRARIDKKKKERVVAHLLQNQRELGSSS
ncbi:protein FAM133-like [Archocentrus centrarchus]|uniref:protein FAM133-like n=1 Tax=Archocentrus centrarchus TaxID=63155 RepID=UPI0011E9DF20|nr:protein FAM133-like [Archocentrus centrarchus]